MKITSPLPVEGSLALVEANVATSDVGSGGGDNLCKSPLLLERSETEFRRQVDTVYETKMIPRPTSGISGQCAGSVTFFSLDYNMFPSLKMDGCSKYDRLQLK